MRKHRSRSWSTPLRPTSASLQRASPPYSHQSQLEGKVERFQLRTTRLQWSHDLKVEPHMHSVFILNSYLVHFVRKDVTLREPPLQLLLQHRWFHCVLGDIRNIPTQKLRLKNQHQKLQGIWLGRDLVTNEHILALPYVQQASIHSNRSLQVQADHSGTSRRTT